MTLDVMVSVRLCALLSGALLLSSCIIGAKYTVGGTLTGLSGTGLVLEDNLGNDLALSSNGTFAFSSGLRKNDAYSVTVRTQPTDPIQSCAVQNASGTIDNADITNVIVSCTQAARFAFVANQLSNTVSAFTIDTADGSLAAVGGSPFVSGTTPIALAVDPNGVYLYVVNSGSDSISTYAIDTATGVLTPSGLGTATGSAPDALAIDPTGRFLYVANLSANTVSAFTIDASSGALTEITGSPFAVGDGPASLKVNPTGAFLYVTNFDGGNVDVLHIDAQTGVLSGIAGSPFAAGSGAVSIVIDATGTFAYVANETVATISEYSLNASTGALTPVGGSPLSVGSSPETVAVDPAGRFLYAANTTSNNHVASYLITPTSGALTLAGSVASGTLPIGIGVDPAGQYVYVVNDNSNDITSYSVDPSSGLLTAIAQPPTTTGSEPRAIAID